MPYCWDCLSAGALEWGLTVSTYDMNTIIQIHDIPYGKIPYSKVSLYNACKW